MVYGRKKQHTGLSGQCLHARLLRFIHPATGDQMELSSDLPEYFEKILRSIE